MRVINLRLKILSISELGIRLDNFKQSIFPYFLLFFILGLCMVILLNNTNYLPQLLNLYYGFYSPLWLVIPLSVIQEIFFRGYLMAVLKKNFRSIYVVIFLNTILFTLMHLVFPYPEIVLPGAFVAGIGFAITYYFYPNLFLVSIVHVLLNFLIIPLCSLKLVNC